MTEPAPNPRPNLLMRALRRRWPVALGVPFAVVVLAFLFIILVRPLFESRATLRFVETERPLGGALSALGGGAGGFGGGGGLSLLASIAGQGVAIQTEMELLGSRELAREVMNELGFRLELREPARTFRSRVFGSVAIGPNAPVGEFTLERNASGGFDVSGEVVVARDVFRPILNERKEDRDYGTVAVGAPLPIEGVHITLAGAAEAFDEIVFRIHPPQTALEDFRDRVGVDRPTRDADLLAVSVRWTDPELAALATNRLAERFIERRERFLAREFGRTADFLSRELELLQAELRGAEEALRDYREVEEIVEPEAQATAAVEQFAELQARRDLLAAERGALLSLLEDAGGLAAADPGAESPYRRLVFFPTLLTSNATAEMITLLGELENERAALLDRRTPESREVRVLTERIGEVEDQLRSVAETYLAGLHEQVSSLDELLLGFRSRLETVPAVELEYLRLRRQVELLNELFLFMELRQKEAEITAAGETGGAHIVDRGEPAIEPVRPQPRLTLILALIAGLGMGIGGAVLLEHVAPAREEDGAEALP